MLGNIKVGDGVIIEDTALVNRPIKPYTRVAGIPAKELEKLDENTDYIYTPYR